LGLSVWLVGVYPFLMFHVEQNQKYMFDVLVIGGGHAGIEASMAAARMGVRFGLITVDPSTIGRL